MKNKLSLLVILCIALGFYSCSSVRVSTDYDRTVNFSSYKTFSFHQKGLEKITLNDLDKRRIINAITTELEKKGMKLGDETSSDLVVNILASSKEKVVVTQDPFVYQYPYWGGWRNNNYNVREYTEGTLVIDMIENKKNTLVWQGIGVGLVVSNLDIKAEEISTAVAEIMAKYPPEAKK